MSKDKSERRAENQQLLRELADQLGETTTQPLRQLKRIIQVCGQDFAREIYAETLKVEVEGGMMLPDKSRRRTIGGVYFYTARHRMTEKQRRLIFPEYNGRGNNMDIPKGVPLRSWQERIALIQSLQTQQGEIESMKIFLHGRPGRVEKRDDVVVTTMSYTVSVPNLPRGIPTPPTEPTLLAVYIPPRQWEKVEEAIADPADNLLIDGVCAYDVETDSMAVFVTALRSEMMDAKLKEAKKNAPPKEKPPKVAPSKKEKPLEAKAEPKPVKEVTPTTTTQPPAKPVKKSRIAQMEPVGEIRLQPSVTVNPNLPPDVARKLTELHASANLFRQKVNTILGKPAGQQFGLEMTQKLLKNVEDEIAALEKKYGAS